MIFKLGIQCPCHATGLRAIQNKQQKTFKPQENLCPTIFFFFFFLITVKHATVFNRHKRGPLYSI